MTGCALPAKHADRVTVGRSLAQRAALEPVYEPVLAHRPVDVVPAGALSEDEAVAFALWNNAAFQDLLVDLDVSRADVISAGQLSNPEFWTVFPVGPKQLEFALNMPLEAIWLRPRRLDAARLESRRIGHRLVQDGLNLVRDVRVAYADLVLAHDRLRLADDGAMLRERIASLARARLRAGDISELEAAAVGIDAVIARQDARRLVHDVEIAQARLDGLLGLACGSVQVALVGRDLPPVQIDVKQVVCEAQRTRPDMWALRLAIEAAGERARLARHDYLRVIGVLPDANGTGLKGFEAGPGVQFTVPIFNRNQGAIARAEAEVERSRRQYRVLSQAIAVDVRQSHARLRQASEDLLAWTNQLLPASASASEQAQKAYESGGVSLLLVLETSRQVLSARSRRIELAAEVRRAAAELERAVGRRLFQSPTEATRQPESLPPPTEIREADAAPMTSPRLVERAASDRPAEARL
ncbi:MAG: TolC family protein [Pirellulales bacterium]